MTTTKKVTVYNIYEYDYIHNEKKIVKSFDLLLCDETIFEDNNNDFLIDEKIMNTMRKNNCFLQEAINDVQLSIFNHYGNTVLSITDMINYFNQINHRIDKTYFTNPDDYDIHSFNKKFLIYIEAFRRVLKERMGFKIRLKIIYNLDSKDTNEKPFILIEKVK